MPTLSTAVQHWATGSSHCSQARKKEKASRLEDRGKNTCIDDMIQCSGNPKELTKLLLELIMNSAQWKDVRLIHKINRIPCPCNEQSKNSENSYIHKSIKRIKCLGINLTKAAQGLYIENYDTLLREIKEY